MSLTLTHSRPFTISTYDPPSTPIALAAQNSQSQSPEGQRVGGTRKFESPHTPPEQDKDSDSARARLKALDKTPSNRAKVLPWVEGIITQDYQPPEGMFGPYDSQPPTRRQTVVEATAFSPPRHPFAYAPGTSLPFFALAGEANMGGQEYLADHGQRPASDVLSRGAGLRGQAEHVSLPASNGSPGMGTFGREASQGQGAPTERPPHIPPKSPRKQASPRKPVPTEPLPQTPKARSRAGTVQQVPQEAAQPPETNLHHPHSEYPFSHEDAGRRQAEAMAHLEALQRLESGNSAVTPGRGAKGPRETYETMTSDPSFGHLHHHNGVPIPGSRGDSMQPEAFRPMLQNAPFGGFGETALFRIPFGPNMGIPLGGPLGFDGGGGPPLLSGGSWDLLGMAGGPESVRGGQRRDDRSAYVETVQDDQEPTAKASRSRATSGADKTTLHTQPPGEAARAESAIHPGSTARPATTRERQSAQKPASKAPTAARSTRPPTAAPITNKGSGTHKAPSFAPSQHHTAGRTEQGGPQTATAHIEYPQGQLPQPDYAALAPFLGAYLQQLTRAAEAHPAPSGQSVHPEQHGTVGSAANIGEPGHTDQRFPSATSAHPEPNSLAPSAMAPQDAYIQRASNDEPRSPYAPSVISTTASNIKQAVAESKFHDEVLCQLLDAARLNLIGDEAKKALNRAARARVIELRDLRARGESTQQHMTTSSLEREKRDKKPKSKDHRHSRRRSGSSEPEVRPRSTSKTTATPRAQSRDRHSRRPSNLQELPPLPPVQPKEAVQPTTPPEWARNIIDRLAAFDERFSELERQQEEHRLDDPSQDIPDQLIDDLVFSAQQFANPGYNPGGIHGVAMPMMINPFEFLPEPFPRFSIGETTPRNSARIERLPPNVKQRDTKTSLEWGSDVELPQAGERISPPKTPKTATGPIINIQAPTESNIDKSQRAPTPSVTGTRATAPRRTEVEVIEEQVVSLPDAALPEPMERDLPPRPSESYRSHRPSPDTKSTGLYQAYPPTAPDGDTSISLRHALNSGTVHPAEPITVGSAKTPVIPPQPIPSSTEVPDSQTAYKTAFQYMPRTPPKAGKDVIHVFDPIHSTMADPTPWDLITQRLYSWALVWDEDTFGRAMQEISLGKQVTEFALSIFVMVIFKRMIRKSMSETPLRVCDKLFVPPTMAEAINKAVHANNHKAAQQMLEEMWYPFLFKDPPRVIIALARHMTDDEIWTAHRWDLTTGRLRSYKVCHENRGHDGRPFMWWHAIRAAWPQFNIADPSELAQQTTTIDTSALERNNNSLQALNCARNLFLGFRPEHPTDMGKLRESVWGEVKRLLNKKRMGRLIVEMDSPSHGTSY